MNLWERFEKGLKTVNLTADDISKFKYCGGNMGRHRSYWELVNGKDPLPEHATKCICGQEIKENCYISGIIGDEEIIVIMGNNCIKRFVPKCSRTCKKCGEIHKNRKDNLCNKCRRK